MIGAVVERAQRRAGCRRRRLDVEAALDDRNGGEERLEPRIAASQAGIVEMAAAGESAAGLADPRVDYIVDLAAHAPVALAILHEYWGEAGHRFAGRSNFLAWGDNGWIVLPKVGHCEKFRASFQLVSRFSAS